MLDSTTASQPALVRARLQTVEPAKPPAAAKLAPPFADRNRPLFVPTRTTSTFPVVSTFRSIVRDAASCTAGPHVSPPSVERTTAPPKKLSKGSPVPRYIVCGLFPNAPEPMPSVPIESDLGDHESCG